MESTDKLQGTCSVCLRTMQLHGDHPIRHGFSAVGVRHGQHGGFHTGPCAGTNFPHLGISTEGTQWALDRAHRDLDRVRADLAHLATNPDLVWYPTQYNVRGRPPDLSRPITLKHGEELSWELSRTGAPSYDHEQRVRKVKLDNHASELEHAIAAYENVIATWTPEKYPVTGAAKKVEITHMATPRKSARGEWIGVLCRSTRPGYASDKLVKTDDPNTVTCKKCRKDLGLPPL